MGSALFVVLDVELDGLDTFIDGKALSRAEPMLTAYCRDHGLEDLMSFFSVDPGDAAEFFEDEGLDDAMPELPPVQWFSPEVGLRTVRGLLTGIQEGRLKVKGADALASDLSGLERILEAAHEHHAKWHLAVDF
jgi:hypothetical protein